MICCFLKSECVLWKFADKIKQTRRSCCKISLNQLSFRNSFCPSYTPPTPTNFAPVIAKVVNFQNNCNILHADITDAGQLMFILGSIVLYPQCRIELSVLRQQMLECGGKKILLGADAVQGRDADEAFGEALDKTLEHMRKVVRLFQKLRLQSTDLPVTPRFSVLLHRTGQRQLNRSSRQREVRNIGAFFFHVTSHACRSLTRAQGSRALLEFGKVRTCDHFSIIILKPENSLRSQYCLTSQLRILNPLCMHSSVHSMVFRLVCCTSCSTAWG